MNINKKAIVSKYKNKFYIKVWLQKFGWEYLLKRKHNVPIPITFNTKEIAIAYINKLNYRL